MSGASAAGAWRAFDILVAEAGGEPPTAAELEINAVAVVREVIAGTRDLVDMIDRGEDYEGDSTVIDRLRNALAGKVEP